ncbi:hypothetical protein BV25DRAFT_1806680 [Artomyces pyxidatus]|uniref:Uncharacterized protein n=1 Tax=Artomyces pyxidatus TaxID=48021 RepID=A0ACB8SYI3_9AGAM|nr:hypothetical protein BV25DRAFT_1806680 [Artomyces pyxidatus]
MSSVELNHLATQLRTMLARMRSRRSKTPCSVTGDASRTMHVYPGGPKIADEVLSVLPHNATVHFVHGDLLPKNVMVDGSTITAIIDWANAGFYPDYWQYYRMHDPHQMTPNWSKVLEQVFPGERRQAEINAVEKILHDIAWWL